MEQGSKERPGMSAHRQRTGFDPVDHVALSARDIAESVAWYTRTFRCRVAYQDATWALLDFGNLKIALVVEAEHPPHVALNRADAGSFGTLTTHRDGTRSTYVKDPSGNAIEIMAVD